jgi:hypothetical protein
MSMPSTSARVFWLTLPPMKPAARLNAARLALRGRVAANAGTMIALGKSANAAGQWCATVWDASAIAPGQLAAANAALTPWSPNTVSWARSNTDPHCITAQGSSVSLDAAANEGLPDTLVQACGAAGVNALNVYGPASEAERGQWAAQLGVAVHIHPAIKSTVPAAQFLPNFNDGKPLAIAEPIGRGAFAKATTGLAPWVACAAGLAFASFGAWHWLQANNALNATRAAQSDAMRALQKDESNWAAWLRKTHPGHARDSASSLLELALPALAPTAVKIKTISYEARALNIEWSALTPAEREALTQTLAARGLGVISAGNKARVVWP